MRHWLAGSLSSVAAHSEGRMLAKELPALFRDLPESFKVGHPLPHKTESSSQNSESRNMQVSHGSRGRSHHHPVSRFIHGCELLTA